MMNLVGRGQQRTERTTEGHSLWGDEPTASHARSARGQQCAAGICVLGSHAGGAFCTLLYELLHLKDTLLNS